MLSKDFNLKYCTHCERWLPLRSFRKNKSRPDGLQSSCRDCCKAYERKPEVKSAHNERQKKAYREDPDVRSYHATLTKRPDVRAQKSKARRSKSKISRQWVYDYLLTHPCPCGEADPCCLDFDHIDPTTKKSSIARLTQGGNLKTIQHEIAKCQVLCANCHRKKTAVERGWYSDLIINNE